jgi:hypothetical protein
MNSIKRLSFALVIAALSTGFAQAASRTAPFIDPTVISTADSSNQADVSFSR